MCLFTKNSLKLLLQLQKYIQVHVTPQKAVADAHEPLWQHEVGLVWCI